MTAEANKAISTRVTELLALYSAPQVPVAQLLCDRYDPDRVAYHIVGPDLVARPLTYGELRAQSERFATVLARQGVGVGDRVATLMGKSRELLVALLGIWRLGAVHVPLFTALAGPAIALRLDGSKAKVVVCDASQRAKLEPDEDIQANPKWQLITTGPGDARAQSLDALMVKAGRHQSAAASNCDAPMIHIYTSGTTGRPKAVVVPIKALAAFQAYGEFAFDLQANDVFWNGADPGWAYGLYYGVLVALTTGVESVLVQGGFSAEATYKVFGDLGVTNFAAAPTVYRSLRASGVATPAGLRLRCASSAGEPLTAEVNDWAVKALGVMVHDHYGQTEMGMLINNHHHPALKRPLKPGSMGQVMPGWTATVLREHEDVPAAVNKAGRLAIDLQHSAFNHFSGYLDDPRKSAEKYAGNGRWYLTGDIARVDADGYFFFGSREDDVIIMSGYRIGPFEIESVLLTHQSVAECAVIAVPDEMRGEVMEAYVVPRDPAAAGAALAMELQDWVKTKYAAHAYPRAIYFTEVLPKTPSGKIQRFVLRQQRRAGVD